MFHDYVKYIEPPVMLAAARLRDKHPRRRMYRLLPPRGGKVGWGDTDVAQLPLGHSKLESTVRNLGIDVDDALEIAEQTKV